MGRDGCRGVSVKWIICSLSVFRKTFTKRAFCFTYAVYCLLHFLHSIIYVKLVELQVIWCLICLVSPVLVKVYDVLPLSMNGRVRHPCFEPQRNVPAGSLGVLLLLASLARTSRSRRLGERRKATTGTSLKMFFKRSVECRIGCFLRSIS